MQQSVMAALSYRLERLARLDDWLVGTAIVVQFLSETIALPDRPLNSLSFS